MIGKKPGQENWKMVESDQIQKTDHTEVYVSEQTCSDIGRKHSIAVQAQSEQESLDLYGSLLLLRAALKHYQEVTSERTLRPAIR